MSSPAHRLFSSSVRSSTRANLLGAARSPRAAFPRRMVSSGSHVSHGSTSSDRPWIIGSALVFGPLFLYLLSPSARQSSHNHGYNSHHQEHADIHPQRVESRREEDAKPVADDEGTEVSGQEVKDSMENAFSADSPKDAQEREEAVAKVQTSTVEENSTPEAHPQAGSSTDAKLVPESEPISTSSAPVAVDQVTSATTDREVQNNSDDTDAPTVGSKA